MCRLKRSLYGLKQSLRTWFGSLQKSIQIFGYSQSNPDHTLFLKNKHGKIVVLVLYVDDMVVSKSDIEKEKLYKIIYVENMK